MDVAAVQRQLDAHLYPPTHAYNLATLTPRGVLAERVKKLLKLCPDFFTGRFFLDIGASKGFFSLKAAAGYQRVVAVEPEVEVLRLWMDIAPDNVQPSALSFANFCGGSGWCSLPFDMVWIGNGHHYLHREAPQDWLGWVAALARDRVVIEGPVGASAKGFEHWEPGTVPEELEWLKWAQDVGFRLINTVASVDYTPGRAMWYLRKVEACPTP